MKNFIKTVSPFLFGASLLILLVEILFSGVNYVGLWLLLISVFLGRYSGALNFDVTISKDDEEGQG